MTKQYCPIIQYTVYVTTALSFVTDDSLAVGDLLAILISHRLHPEADPEAQDQVGGLV